MIALGICKACKKLVSQEAKACPTCGQPEPYQQIADDVSLFIQRGRLIEAIKRVRELTGMDLKDSKDFVDQLVKTYRESGQLR